MGGKTLPKTDIFLSYSSEDRVKARAIATCLEHEGFAVWWDAAIHSGESFDLVIERQLAEAKAVVVLWSPNSVSSRWVRAEASSADRSRKLVPVTIEPCVRPIIFELIHTVELSHWNGDVTDPAWGQFLHDLQHIVHSTGEQDEGSHAQVAIQNAHSRTPAPSPSASQREGTSAFPAFGKSPVEDQDEEEAYEATQFSSFEPLHMRPQHFLQLVNDGTTEKQFQIGQGGLRIGRTAPAEVILVDKHVSRRHCQVELDGEELIVVDLGSTNGTFVDGERVTDRAVLPVGSVLKVGQCELIHELRAPALT